jgi:hypothetical protein
MPGAGGITAVNHIYNIAPKDGTVFGSVVASVAVSPITGAAGARFDPLERFPKRLNRSGFHCADESDSRILLERRPVRDGKAIFGGSA